MFPGDKVRYPERERSFYVLAGLYDQEVSVRLPLFQFSSKHFHLTIVTRNNSLEIWAVKLRILLINLNMLKSIAKTLSECTAKQENNTNYNTDYIVPDFIDFFGDD